MKNSSEKELDTVAKMTSIRDKTRPLIDQYHPTSSKKLLTAFAVVLPSLSKIANAA